MKIAYVLAVIAVAGVVGCELKPPSANKEAPATARSETAVSSTQARRQASYLSGGQGFFSLANYRGRVVLLDFGAAWSPISRDAVSAWNQLHAAHTNLAIIGMVVESGPEDETRRNAAEWSAAYPLVYVPREILDQYGVVRALPTRLLLDRKGQVRHQYAGAADLDKIQNDALVLMRE